MEEEIIEDEKDIGEEEDILLPTSVLKRRVGRPRKVSGIYYSKQVLITERLFKYIARKRLPKEPLGSVLERIVNKAIFEEEEKKLWSILWNEADHKKPQRNF